MFFIQLILLLVVLTGTSIAQPDPQPTPVPCNECCADKPSQLTPVARPARTKPDTNWRKNFRHNSFPRSDDPEGPPATELPADHVRQMTDEEVEAVNKEQATNEEIRQLLLKSRQKHTPTKLPPADIKPQPAVQPPALLRTI